MGYNLLEDTNRSETIDKHFLKPANRSPGHGLHAEYFDNLDLKGAPVLTRIDSIMRQYWWRGFPGKQVSENHFSMRWTGMITPPATGLYEIKITTNGKNRLYIDDSVIVNDWDHLENSIEQKPIFMEKGKEYKIEVDYADSVNYASINLQWRRFYEKPSDERLAADAVSLAKRSDVVIVVAGISPQLEGEESPSTSPASKEETARA